MALLKQEYKSPTLEEAKRLAMKVLSKTLDVKLTPEKGSFSRRRKGLIFDLSVEMGVLVHKDGKTSLKDLTDVEVRDL